MKFPSALLYKILGNKNGFSFEEKFITQFSLYAAFLCFISIFLNYLVNLGAGTVITVTVSFFVYLSAYILVRYYNKVNLSRLIITFYTILFCNFYWLTNYGSKGYAMGIFVIYISIMLIIWGNKQILIILTVVAINIVLMYSTEKLFPGIIPDYPSVDSRLLDAYGSVLMYISILSILIIAAKNNYIKQYKLAKQSDMLKSAFLANMSHEIRTPVNAVVGFSKLLAKKELSKEKKEIYATVIQENSNYLLKLLSDILDISMIESGDMKIVLQKLDINDLFAKLYIYCNELLEKAGKKAISLISDCPEKQSYMETDAVRLEQILSNLLSNAVKFTSEGFIRFGFFKKDTDIIFYVQDTGIGIKDELQPIIFRRFIKGENIDNVKFERGTGLGLSLSKEIIEMMGGKVWFTSQYLEGSKFYFSLPVTPYDYQKQFVNR